MSQSNERSAEFYRGALRVAEDNNLYKFVAHWRALLAAAEAREATQPTAAAVIEAAEIALDAWRHHMSRPTGAMADYGLLMQSLATAQNETDAALAKIASWKEANGGK